MLTLKNTDSAMTASVIALPLDWFTGEGRPPLFQGVFVGAGKWFQAPNEPASARGKLRPLGLCVSRMGG
jgi:hypothetical protein